MYFNRKNPNFLTVGLPVPENDYYMVKFLDSKKAERITPLEYKGLVITRTLRNAGIPSNVMEDLAEYVFLYARTCVDSALQTEYEEQAGASI